MATPVGEHTPILARYQPHAAFLYSHAAGVGAIAGAVSFAVSAFFGYDCLYPATITGFCFCAWAGTALSQTPQQVVWNQKFRDEILSSLARTVRKYPEPRQERLDSTLEWVEVKRWPPVTRYFSTNPFIAVRAFTNGTDLKYVAVNLQTQDTQLGDIQIDGSLKKTMEFLKNCFVTLEDDDSPVFSLSYHTFSGTYESKTLRADLLLRQRDCAWNICDTTSQTIICTDLTTLSWRCSAATTEFFASKGLSSSYSWDSPSIIDQIQCVKGLVLHEIFPNMLDLEPIHHASGFGKHISVSKFMWAITLIRYKGISGNHAQIIIEGINDGCFEEIPIGHYFVCLADLLGTKKIRKGDGEETEVRAIRTDLKTEFDVRYEARSETWKRSSSSVKDMIRAIVEERDNPPSGFAIYGRHSILASKKVVEDSCITWAISRLALIKIVLKEEKKPIFYTDTSAFAHYKPGEKAPWVVMLDVHARRDLGELPKSEVSQLPYSL